MIIHSGPVSRRRDRVATHGLAAQTTPPESLGPRPAPRTRPQLSAPRANVLQALLAAGKAATVATVADALGQHPNTVREHLDALVADGRVERIRSAPSGRGRPAWLYGPVVVESGGSVTASLSTGAGSYDGQEYLELAMALIDQVSADSPHPRALARRAGERWGRTLAKQRQARARTDPVSDRDVPTRDVTDTVVDVLRDLRFESQPGSDGRTGSGTAGDDTAGDSKTMRLTTCPFLDAAKQNPGVVCQIHAGIVRGALEQAGGDPDSSELREFAEPGACVLRLGRRPAASGGTTPRTGDE